MVEKRKHKIMIKRKKIYDSPFPLNNANVIVGLQEIGIWLCIVWFKLKNRNLVVMIWFFQFGLFDIRPLQLGKSFLKVLFENRTNRKTSFLFIILMILIKNQSKIKKKKKLLN